MKVLISTSSFAASSSAPLQMLEEQGIEWTRNPHGRTLTEAEIAELLGDACGLVAGTEPLTQKVLAAAKGLRVISRVGVGLDNVDLEEARRLGIAVANTPDAPTQAVAELTLAGILTLVRGIHRMNHHLHQGSWKRETGGLLSCKRVGIVGLGRVGKRLSELLQPFQVSPFYYDIAPDEAWAQAHGLELVPLDQLLGQCDVVTLHASLKPSAPCLIGSRELSLMRDGSYLVNTARGVLVDEEALLEALNAGKLAGAYLDTFQREPYTGPLKDCPQALLTPHAGSSARECRNAMELEAVENLIYHLKRDPRR